MTSENTIRAALCILCPLFKPKPPLWTLKMDLVGLSSDLFVPLLSVSHWIHLSPCSLLLLGFLYFPTHKGFCDLGCPSSAPCSTFPNLSCIAHPLSWIQQPLGIHSTQFLLKELTPNILFTSSLISRGEKMEEWAQGGRVQVLWDQSPYKGFSKVDRNTEGGGGERRGREYELLPRRTMRSD